MVFSLMVITATVTALAVFWSTARLCGRDPVELLDTLTTPRRARAATSVRVNTGALDTGALDTGALDTGALVAAAACAHPADAELDAHPAPDADPATGVPSWFLVDYASDPELDPMACTRCTGDGFVRLPCRRCLGSGLS